MIGGGTAPSLLSLTITCFKIKDSPRPKHFLTWCWRNLSISKCLEPSERTFSQEETLSQNSLPRWLIQPGFGPVLEFFHYWFYQTPWRALFLHCWYCSLANGEGSFNLPVLLSPYLLCTSSIVCLSLSTCSLWPHRQIFSLCRWFREVTHLPRVTQLNCGRNPHWNPGILTFPAPRCFLGGFLPIKT